MRNRDIKKPLQWEITSQLQRFTIRLFYNNNLLTNRWQVVHLKIDHINTLT